MTETLDYDDGRQVSVYLPAGSPEAIVFAADGEATATWGALLEVPDLPATMLVGVHGLAEEMPRLHEYSPVFDADRFAAHEDFFVRDVSAWVTARFGVALPPARTAVFGASAGGELALALGLRHPDVYGTVLSGSPGAGFQPPETLPTPLPRTYLVAGTQEPFFLANARRWQIALEAAGAGVVLRERNATHGSAQWRAELPRMVRWASGSANGPSTGSADEPRLRRCGAGRGRRAPA